MPALLAIRLVQCVQLISANSNQMTIKKEGFFGTDNLHRAGWTILIGVIGFIGTLIYKKINEPQRVVFEAPAPNHSGVKVTPNATSIQPTDDMSESSSPRISTQATSSVTNSSTPPSGHQLDVETLRSQFAIADKMYGADTQNLAYMKIIDRALNANELDLALSVVNKMYGADPKNDGYDKIIHHAILLKKLDFANQVVPQMYGADRKNAALKLILEASTIAEAPGSGRIVTQSDADFKLGFYKEVYDFAYSPFPGMNMFSSNAKFFADKWVARCTPQDLESFKELYRFAYSPSPGMNMIGSNAQFWAEGKVTCLQK